jgi:hypothetical protein
MTDDIHFELCPFCGNDLNEQDYLDTIYPLNREKTLYNCVCNHCEASVIGYNAYDVLKRWNYRHKVEEE